VLEAAQRARPLPPSASRRRRQYWGLAVVVIAAAGIVVALLVGRATKPTRGPYSAPVSWPAVKGAAAARIELNGQLIDQVPTSGGGTYELQGLWPDTRFTVGIDVLGRRGQLLAHFPRAVRTTRATAAFPRLYSPAAFINRQIQASPPLAPNSRAMVAESLESQAESANLSNDDTWGIPIAYADPQSERSTVRCTVYGCSLRVGPARIPTGAEPNAGSDHHLVVLQPDGGELDLWLGQKNGEAWSAGSLSLESASGLAANCSGTSRCGGADAAYLALGAGVIRPEEIAQGHIDHALAIAVPNTRAGYVACPAGHGDGQHDDPNALPIGAHVQLDPAVEVARLPIPTWQKVIAVALQRYGAYVVDTGGSVALYGQSDLGRGFDAWAKAGVPASSPSLTNLPWASMRVLAMTRCAS
jgi:hypothetical protein